MHIFRPTSLKERHVGDIRVNGDNIKMDPQETGC
jgi:hypothetical protein